MRANTEPIEFLKTIDTATMCRDGTMTPKSEWKMVDGTPLTDEQLDQLPMIENGTLVIDETRRFERYENCNSCWQEIDLRGAGFALCVVTDHMLLASGYMDCTAPVCGRCARKIDAPLYEAYDRWQNESTATSRAISDDETFIYHWRRSLAVLHEEGPITIERLDRARQVLADGRADATGPSEMLEGTCS